MSYWISQGSRELQRREGKDRRGFKSINAALSWEWKKLNISDERTIISNILILPKTLSFVVRFAGQLVLSQPDTFPFLPSSPSVPLAGGTIKCNHKKSDSGETKTEVDVPTVPISKTHSSVILMRHYCWHLLGKVHSWVQAAEQPSGCWVYLENWPICWTFLQRLHWCSALLTFWTQADILKPQRAAWQQVSMDFWLELVI